MITLITYDKDLFNEIHQIAKRYIVKSDLGGPIEYLPCSELGYLHEIFKAASLNEEFGALWLNEEHHEAHYEEQKTNDSTATNQYEGAKFGGEPASFI